MREITLRKNKITFLRFSLHFYLSIRRIWTVIFSVFLLFTVILIFPRLSCLYSFLLYFLLRVHSILFYSIPTSSNVHTGWAASFLFSKRTKWNVKRIRIYISTKLGLKVSRTVENSSEHSNVDSTWTLMFESFQNCWKR